MASSGAIRGRTGAGVASVVAVVLLLGVFAAGCRSAAPPAANLELGEAIDRLNRPLPGSPAALYRMRVSSSGGLRLAVLTSGNRGRMTVSEPFGSAVSLTAWTGADRPTFYDLREGCRVEASDLEQVLGVRALPLPQAVRLLGGRLPSVAGDRVLAQADGRLLVEGSGWSALVTLRTEPWRVVEVEQAKAGQGGWRLVLGSHSLSVPGSMRVVNADGRWAELELVRLEWNEDPELPELPVLPPCLTEARP